MKRFSLLVVFALTLGACSGAQKTVEETVTEAQPLEAAEPEDVVPETETWRATRPTPGEPPEIVIPGFQEARLGNGLTILVSERRGLPLVAATVAVRAGSAAEKPEKAGLADFTYELMLEGAGKRDAIALADAFGNLGTEPSVSTESDGASFSVRVLTRNADAALALLSDVVRRPKLTRADFDRKKKETLADLARMVGDPRFLSREAVAPVVYGSDHPYGHLGSGTPATVASITHADTRAFYKAHVGPRSVALVLAGDVSLDEAKAWAKKHFGSWKSAAKPQKTPPAANAASRANVVLVPKAGLGQTVLTLGRPALPVGHADEFPLRIANYVYGGSFSGRLNMNLREDKGYTYGAYAWVDAKAGTGAVFSGSSVRADVTGASLKEVFAELDGLSERPISEDEFRAAVEGLMRSMPGWFETVEGLAGSAARLFFQQQPLDRYQKMLEAYRSMELEAVRNAASNYLSPGSMQVVLVGDPEAVKTQVGPLGLGEIVERAPAGGDSAAP